MTAYRITGSRSLIRGCRRSLLAVVCAVVLLPGDAFAIPQSTQSAVIPADQLDSLVAPIALYPDPMLAQTLAASTYPLEVLQLQQWLERNPGLKDQALVDAVSKQPWDPSVQAMAALPDVVKRLADDIQWTTDLGNAFLAQESDVMAAVQRMRQKAEGTGSLATTAQQIVETRVVENREVIVIEQADPEVVYVPSYNPVTVYGPPVYPYPAIAYPPLGYYAAGAAISFGVGVAMGAAWGGGWGWGAGWGRNDIDFNRNNTFNRNTNINASRTGNYTGNRSGSWQHNPQHRGGAPYSNRTTADRFGGTARGDSLANRQAGARQQVNRQGGNVRSGAVGTTGTLGSGGAGYANRSGAAGGSGRVSGSNPGNRTGGGADRVGGRDLSGSTGANRGAFGGGGSSGYSGSNARSSHDRGASSMGSRSGSRSSGVYSRPSGGGSRPSGGSRGGGSRGGGRR